MKITRYLFTFTAIWALLAGLVILIIPMGTSASVSSSSSGNSETIVSQVSFFAMSGWWGIWILIAFAALYYGPLHFYRRGSRPLVALFASAAIILSVLAGFSIGLFYFPSALTALIGLVLLFFVPQN